MRRSPGFTLVEMVVVLVLLAVLAALAAPSFSRTIVSARLRASASDVRAALARARLSAVAGGRQRSVVFDLEKGEYGLDNDAVRNRFPDPIRLGNVRLTGEPAEGVAVRVRFFPDGTADQAEISVESGDGATVRVNVDPLTGIAEAGT
jgi:general secretion pathway protein H